MNALLLGLILASPGSSAVAAPTRFDVGQRLIRVEERWLTASADRKDAAVPAVGAAVQQFFGGRLAEAARLLDQAEARLEGREPTTADALDLRLRRPVLEPGAPMTIEVRWAYPVPGGGPVRVTVGDQTFEAVPGTPASVEVGAAPGEEGDPNLPLSVDGRERRLALSVVRGFEARRQRLAESPSSEARDLGRALERALSPTAETLPPFHQTLRDAESLADGAALRERGRLAWTTFEGTILRAAWPVPLPERPVVLVLLHGAGGSENLFFEGYGRGLAVRMALDRGWVVAAPRSAPSAVDQTVKWAIARLGVQPRAVLVAGHSMGGAMALRATATPAAMALFAPAASAVPEILRPVPTYLAVGEGELPFLKASAERLREQFGREEFEVLPHCEHLMVVPEALPRAFAFFDRVLASGLGTGQPEAGTQTGSPK